MAILSSSAFVVVMQTTKLSKLEHLAFLRALCSPALRRIFAERQMSAPAVVIANIGGKRSVQRTLSEDDHVIQAFAANGSDQPFNVGPLPRRARCREHLLAPVL